MKVKLFFSSNDLISSFENEINEFFENNPKIEIIDIKQDVVVLGHSLCSSISIFYKE